MKYRQIYVTVCTAGLAKDCRVGLRWHFCCGCPISKPRPVLDSSSKTTQAMCFRFSKNQKMSSFGKKWCFGDFASRIDLLREYRVLAITSNTNVKLNCASNTNVKLNCVYEFKGFFQKSFVWTGFCLYLVFQSIPINIDRNDFQAETQKLGFLKN